MLFWKKFEFFSLGAKQIKSRRDILKKKCFLHESLTSAPFCNAVRFSLSLKNWRRRRRCGSNWRQRWWVVVGFPHIWNESKLRHAIIYQIEWTERKKKKMKFLYFFLIFTPQSFLISKRGEKVSAGSPPLDTHTHTLLVISS
jgi:hypothetical protein